MNNYLSLTGSQFRPTFCPQLGLCGARRRSGEACKNDDLWPIGHHRPAAASGAARSQIGGAVSSHYAAGYEAKAEDAKAADAVRASPWNDCGPSQVSSWCWFRYESNGAFLWRSILRSQRAKRRDHRRNIGAAREDTGACSQRRQEGLPRG